MDGHFCPSSSCPCPIFLNSSAFHKIFQNVISVDHEDSNAKRIRELCPCSDEAMGKMKMAMTEYQIDQKTHPGKTTVDDLVKNIKKIAFGEL